MENEFMLLIHNTMDHTAQLSPEEMQRFLQECMEYIGGLTRDGKLKGAQPLVKQGIILSGSQGAWKDGPFNESKEVVIGYYHVFARDMDEAIAIAKGNPEFKFTKTARIEIRPIRVVEQSSGFVYPGGK